MIKLYSKINCGLGPTGTIFNVFGMTRPGFEPAPPASEADALTITLSGPASSSDSYKPPLCRSTPVLRVGLR